MALFVPNMTGFVQNMTGFVLHVTGFVLNITIFFLDITGFIKQKILDIMGWPYTRSNLVLVGTSVHCTVSFRYFCLL